MKPSIVFLAILPLCAAPGGAGLPIDPVKQEKKAEPAVEKKAEEAKPAEKTEAAPAADPGDSVLSGSVDVGYRFRTDIMGNPSVYRSVVNLGEGVKLFGFDLRLQSKKTKLFDRINAFGLGWGGDPYTTARLDAIKERVYDLHLDYKNIAYFNSLPSFANPFLDRGGFMSEHGFDTRRRLFDAELRLRPGTHIIPYIAFSHDSGDGRGVTTFVTGGNEYPVFNSLVDSNRRVRGGVSFEFNRGHLTFEEGGTWFKDDDSSSANQRNNGNRTTPYIGQPLYLTGLNEFYRVRGDGAFTRIIATFTPLKWLDLSGQFLYSNPSTSTKYSENAVGNFVDLATLQFFTTLGNVGTAAANQPHSSGSFHAELRPVSRLRILESVTTDRMTATSAILLSELTSITPQALAFSANDGYRVNYSRNQTEAILEVTKWLSLRGGFRNVWGDARVRAPQVNGTSTEIGELKQNVVLAGAMLRFGQKLRVNLDAEGASAYKSYFRTSLHDYQKGTARARYQAFTNLGFTASATALYNENPTPGVNFDYKARSASAGFFWNPNGAKNYSFLGDYTFSSLQSNLPYFVPSTAERQISSYRDNAHTMTMLFDCVSKGKYGAHLSLGGSVFKSSGSRASTYAQPVARLAIPLHERASFFTEWRYYGLGEQYYQYEGFRTHVFMMGLRLTK